MKVKLTVSTWTDADIHSREQKESSAINTIVAIVLSDRGIFIESPGTGWAHNICVFSKRDGRGLTRRVIAACRCVLRRQKGAWLVEVESEKKSLKMQC